MLKEASTSLAMSLAATSYLVGLRGPKVA